MTFPIEFTLGNVNPMKRRAMKNVFSTEWYDTFLESISKDGTLNEVAFIERQLPVERYPRLLDLCCGPGRHACVLSQLGYQVMGIDSNENAIRIARERCRTGVFEVMDMRSLGSLAEPFDAVINLWHSFGYFDDATNRNILSQVHSILRPDGRAIFDLYNNRYLAHSPPEQNTIRDGRRIRTRHVRAGHRLSVALEYDDREGDQFDWRLYSPEEFDAICRSAGLDVLFSCSWFNESKPVSSEQTRMQFVLQKRHAP